MLIMKLVKKLALFITGLFSYLFLPLAAFAVTQSVDPCSGTTGISAALCSLGGANLGLTIRNIIVFFVIIAVLIALIYLLYGGIKWIMSKGEKTEVESARNHITAAIAGLIVVFLAIFIISLVLSAFGIDWKQLVIPKLGGTTPQPLAP
jgi:hypothetical protein